MNIFTFTEVKKDFPNALERVYEAGQIIFYHGDAPNQVMFIKSGAVKFYDTDTDGNEKILHIGGEGSIFPLFYAFEDKESIDAFYATVDKTVVLIVPLADFHNKLKTSPEYAFRALRWYAEEMDHIVLRLKSLEKSTAKQKVLQALYYLSGQHARKSTNKPKWFKINFPLTQQTLADMTGLTRETVNITLKDAEVLKFVRMKRQIFEVNREEIKAILG